MPEQLHNIGQRRAWVVWLVALSVYVLAVFHRSSLGVAGLLAADRFGISAGQLAVFTVLQLLVYAGMQVPVGVLLDQYGSRRMLLAGVVTMTVAQLGFAFVTDFTGAVLARAVLGAGDAMVFISVIRLVGAWFRVRQAPMVTQLTGQAGQLGAIAAAGPLAWALHQYGWTTTFAAASTIGMVLMVAVAMLVKDSPYRLDAPLAIKLDSLARTMRTLWGHPGNRLGMWSHFVSPFAATAFLMLWGYPFLLDVQGWSPGQAGALLTAMSAWVLLFGVALGWLTGRFPFYRTAIVIAVVLVMAILWGCVLIRSTPAPGWLMVATALATASGGPTSMIGFDLARTFIPHHAIGRANGIVNIGGFTAAVLALGGIGVVLDLVNSGGMAAYTLADYRIAMLVQYPLWAIGIIQILRYRRRAIRHLERHHPDGLAELKAGRQWSHPGSGADGL